jgi:hypothetical protein
MTKTELNRTIKRYCENKDFETAKNYICSHGPLIQGFDIEDALKKVAELENPKKELPKKEKEKKESE